MQALSDQYLSASWPREAENHLQNGLSVDFGPETSIQSWPQESAFALGKQSPFQRDVASLSPSGQPYEEAVTQGYCQIEQGAP